MFLSNTEMDSGFYTLKFDSLLLKEAVVEADGIIPPLREQQPLSSESDPDESTDGGDVAYARGALPLQLSLDGLKKKDFFSNTVANLFCFSFFPQKFWTLLKNSQLR